MSFRTAKLKDIFCVSSHCPTGQKKSHLIYFERKRRGQMLICPAILYKINNENYH